MNKILIIEDNFEVADNLSEILELSGYQTEVANNGKEGVAKANSFEPSLILCDVMMPELDGFGVQKILSSCNIGEMSVIFHRQAVSAVITEVVILLPYKLNNCLRCILNECGFPHMFSFQTKPIFTL